MVNRLLNLTAAVIFSGIALSQSEAAEVRNCEVSYVRRLNVSNGVQLGISHGCQTPSFNNISTLNLKADQNSEAAISQITTLGTAALVNGLRVDISFETSHMNCRGSQCELVGLNAFEIRKPN